MHIVESIPSWNDKKGIQQVSIDESKTPTFRAPLENMPWFTREIEGAGLLRCCSGGSILEIHILKLITMSCHVLGRNKMVYYYRKIEGVGRETKEKRQLISIKLRFI